MCEQSPQIHWKRGCSKSGLHQTQLMDWRFAKLTESALVRGLTGPKRHRPVQYGRGHEGCTLLGICHLQLGVLKPVLDPEWLFCFWGRWQCRTGYNCTKS
ncbi:hypothetical protein ABBQ32_000945 [Trebouxia sp. C0010 RCD-2024]